MTPAITLTPVEILVQLETVKLSCRTVQLMLKNGATCPSTEPLDQKPICLSKCKPLLCRSVSTREAGKHTLPVSLLLVLAEIQRNSTTAFKSLVTIQKKMPGRFATVGMSLGVKRDSSTSNMERTLAESLKIPLLLLLRRLRTMIS